MDLNISAIQFDIEWENKDKNISKIETFLKSVPSDTEIVVLPEMFTTGFSMNTGDLAETMHGDTIQWMKKISLLHNIIVAGSVMIRENKLFRNRFLWIDPKGSVCYYDKRHSFGLAGENENFSAGIKREIFEYKGWRFFPSICYDLRFPVWLKNNIDYHVMLNVANWPSPRSKHWNAFLISRAIENQSYIVGVNRVGKDGEGREYSGDSSIIDFNGNYLNSLRNNEGIVNSTLSLEKLHIFRNKFPFLKDQDTFLISD